jgi:hypothetical protein
MIKLVDILKEIKINKPLTKKQILEWIINNGNEFITDYESWEELVDNIGDENENEWGEEIVNYFKAYFDNFKGDEIYSLYISDNITSQNTLPKLYKDIISFPSDEGDSRIILHNLGKLNIQ